MDEMESIPILAFHKVDPRFEWGVTRATPRRFRKIIQYLYDAGYTGIGANDLLHPETLDPQKKVVGITFDDSYASLYEHAFPVLQEFGFSATVFVITDFIGKLNTWDVNLGWLTFKHLDWTQMREMEKHGISFGSHTVSHPDLTRISPERIRNELGDSKKILEDGLGKEIPLVSYPFGRFNPAIVHMSQEAGYQKACAFFNKIGKTKESFVLERKAYYLMDSMFSLRSKLHTNVWSPCEDVKLRVINFCSHGTSIVKHFILRQ